MDDLGDFEKYSKAELVAYIVRLRAEIDALTADVPPLTNSQMRQMLDNMLSNDRKG